MTNACPDTRWVGALPAGGACPDPGPGWEKSRLISDPAAPASLRRYCVYEWEGGASGGPDLGDLPSGAATWLDRDCFASVGQSDASDVEAIVRPILTAAQETQLEIPATSSLTGTAVDVMILDTWASPANHGRSLHGFAMAGIVESVACGALGNAPCPIQALPSLALDRYGPDRTVDPVHGGHYGSQSQLVRAIYEAVNGPNGGHVVLNISAGWDDRYNDSTAYPGQLSQPVTAVRDALEYAACQGALVITAAGNATGGPDPGERPIYPAAFEQLPAPACVGTDRPLVYAVSGVDGTDSPLPNARPLARAKLAAPAFAVPSRKEIGGSVVAAGPYTGSSVAAAEVSAIAALVWSLEPALAAGEVMDVIRSSGVALDEDAEFCLAPPCGRVKRASVCRTLNALRPADVSCTGLRIPAGTGSNVSYDQGTIQSVVAVPARPGSGLTLTEPSQPTSGACSVATYSLESAQLTAAELCPSEVLSSDLLLPSVDPQPPTDPCPACIFSIDVIQEGVILELAISERVPATTTIVPQTLTLSLGRDAVFRYDLGSATDESTGTNLREGLTPGMVYQVELPESSLDYRVEYDNVSIEWADTESFHSSFPVVVTR